MKTGKISVHNLCFVAFAICINFIGGQIALFLKLPIYLDSIGTVFTAMTLGPIYGMLPNVLSGLLMGMTVDIYSLYYAPVGIILGLITGLVYQKYQPKKWGILAAAAVINEIIAVFMAKKGFEWAGELPEKEKGKELPPIDPERTAGAQ